MVNLGDRSGWRHAILHAEGERWYSKGDQTRYRLEWNARKGALEVVDAGKKTYPQWRRKEVQPQEEEGEGLTLGCMGEVATSLSSSLNRGVK